MTASIDIFTGRAAAATRETIAADMREAFASMRGMFSSGMDRDAIRDRIQALGREVLARHLTANQLGQLEALQRARAESLLGFCWRPSRPLR